MKSILTTPKGDKIAYVENGSGDPVVLVHGFTGNTSAWADTLTNLGKKYHVYAYDMLGHGETVMADNDAVGETALADQLHDFLVGLDLDFDYFHLSYWLVYSTVTDLARFFGLSMSQPFSLAA